MKGRLRKREYRARSPSSSSSSSPAPAGTVVKRISAGGVVKRRSRSNGSHRLH
eukprot:m.205142 g.205142  ORF g.205142 m.205142 type:complete len:53 (+) comp22012_c7_seq1:3091-3249(+)